MEFGDIMIVLTNIKDHIAEQPSDSHAYMEYFQMVKELGKIDKNYANKYNLWLREVTTARCTQENEPTKFAELYEVVKLTYLFMAQEDLDSYLLYLEWDRPLDKRFYQNRRKVLLPLVKDLQDLADDKIDFLGISMPPRTGKSTLCIFFMSWIMGRNPDVANVMSGHSDKLTNGFYRETMSIITDTDTYLWSDVFPTVELADTSAKNETIDLGHKKRFPTFTARSIGGTLTGAVEIGNGGILYVDDLIEDLEESLNPLRLQAKYDAYLNQLKDRKKNGAKELMVGTRWNVADPLGRIAEQYEGNERYRFTVLSATDDDGHSNFQYDFNLGFDDRYYADMKASIDDATWCAKYMGKPYVREGLLFPKNGLKYYNGVLPDGEYQVMSVCDVAWGGGDSLSMPFAYIFGSDVYIHDVVFNNGDKTITQPLVLSKIMEHRPYMVRFEANNGGAEYADAINTKLQDAGYHTHIESARASNQMSKNTKILQYSADIKNWYFIDESKQSGEYKLFMKELWAFSQTGKNPHDDAPDSLAQLADRLYHGTARVEIGQRVF